MPTATYTPIASTTLSSAQATVTFTNLNTLAAGMRDLILVCSPVDTSGFQTVDLQFNSDTGNNYSEVIMYGDGSTTISSANSARNRILGQAYAATSTERISIIFNIFDFSQTNKHKSVLIRGNASAYLTVASANRWANTAAITSITCLGNGNFGIGSTFSLYGVIA